MNQTFFNTTEITNKGELVSNIFKIESVLDFGADLIVFINQMSQYIFIKKDNPGELLYDYMNNHAYISTMIADVDIIEYITKQFQENFQEVIITKLN